jgi:hypothetical protein
MLLCRSPEQVEQMIADDLFEAAPWLCGDWDNAGG